MYYFITTCVLTIELCSINFILYKNLFNAVFILTDIFFEPTVAFGMVPM